MRRAFFALPLAVVVLAGRASIADAAPAVANVTVTSSRVHLGDLVIGLADDVASADLGPSPSGSGTRLVTREELQRALHERGIDDSKSLPEAVRVHRKLRVLSKDDLARIVTDGLEGKLPRGVTLRDIRALAPATIPDGYTDVRCDLPRPPHRTGLFASEVRVDFFEDGRALWTLRVPVDLSLSQEAVSYDVPRGSHVTFVIRRGLVEVSSTGTVTVDADIGTVTPIVVAPSGRSLPARLEDANTAVMVDGA